MKRPGPRQWSWPSISCCRQDDRDRGVEGASASATDGNGSSQTQRKKALDGRGQDKTKRSMSVEVRLASAERTSHEKETMMTAAAVLLGHEDEEE